MTASLYIHVPFCAGACDYCDFYSVSAGVDDRRFDIFVDRVLEDAGDALDRFGVDRVPTVYMGGGTPSLLGGARLGRLFRGLAGLLPNVPEEFTVEANPESADEAFFTACRAGGVSRISLGVQTFHGPSRNAVSRIGDAAILRERLSLTRSFYVDNFSVDLIAGLPLQDEAVLRNDIEGVLTFNPGHVSLYSLTVEEDTPLAKKSAAFQKCETCQKDEFQKYALDSDETDRLWLLGRDLLEQAGYCQYEVSNFCRKGKESKHNGRYWRMENWLGIGPAASGTIIDDRTGTGRRWTVNPDVGAYLVDAPAGSLGVPVAARADISLDKSASAGEDVANPFFRNSCEEVLDSLTLMEESFLMGYRTPAGPDEALFQKRFRRSIESCIPTTLGKWRERGLFRQNGLTREGLLFLNRFLPEAFAELGEVKEGRKRDIL
jgi:oxygen-independent coproporphyrinogen-3 oxidase